MRKELRVWNDEEKTMYYEQSYRIDEESSYFVRFVEDKGEVYQVNVYSNGKCIYGAISMDEPMLYTGLNDKNGNKIFEGDIARYTFDVPGSPYATENGLKSRIGKVFWSDWRASFAIGRECANNDLFTYIKNGNTVEVIGNIYENPELLKEGR